MPKKKKYIDMAPEKPKIRYEKCVLCGEKIELDKNLNPKNGIYESYIIKQSNTTTMAAGYLCLNCFRKDISERVVYKKEEVLIKI